MTGTSKFAAGRLLKYPSFSKTSIEHLRALEAETNPLLGRNP